MNVKNALVIIYLAVTVQVYGCFQFNQLPQAVVTVPVADAVMRRMGNCNAQAYYDLPYSEVIDSEAEACERGYQLLFNERVGILEWQGDEVRVCVPHIYYQPARTEKPLSSYWVLASTITTLEALEQQGIDTSLFPAIKHINQFATYEDEVGLCYPWTHEGITYSVGTRFKVHSILDDYVSVYLFDVEAQRWTRAKIDSNMCVFFQNRSIEQSINLMLSFMRTWANYQDGVIPYVWGGASFTHVVPDNIFTIKQPDQIQVYDREQAGYPKTGFDCSCFISRAAQLCNLPYWWGDSVTVQLHGIPVQKKIGIRNGDIIWIPGHVLMISDVERGLLVEARGYGSGYGKVHELHVSEFFEGIENYDELLTAYEQEAPLAVLNRAGQVRRVYKQFCIFDLRASVGG